MNDRVPDQAEAAQRLPLNGFVLDLRSGELLTADGRLAGLRRQALDVLLVLGASAGKVVTRDELMRRVWPDVVVGEGSLTQAIAEIRRTLGDQAHQLVRNVARRGYVLAPAGPEVSVGVDSRAAAEPPLNLSAPAALPMARLRWAVAGGVIALVVLAASALWLAQGRRAEAWSTPVSATRLPAPAHAPALSIAVLPFTVDGMADADWMGDALHGDLITELGRSPDTWLIARDTMATFKGQPGGPRRVGPHRPAA